MPKFLIDENLSPRLADFLRSLGYAASAVRDVGLTGSSDEEVVAWAKTHKHIVITRDIGFGYTYAVRDVMFGLLLLRSKSDEAESFHKLLLRLHDAGTLSSLSPEVFLVVSPTSIRYVRAAKSESALEDRTDKRGAAELSREDRGPGISLKRLAKKY